MYRMRRTGNRWAALETRENALNAVRLGLALVVLITHSWNVTHGPGGPSANPGAIAVDGFFALSGFLIAGSRRRLKFGEFIQRRALRLMPGYFGALFMTAFVVAPAVAYVRGMRYDVFDGIQYVAGNAGLMITQPTVGVLLSDVPVAGVFNASLWTLSFEAAAYSVFGILLSGRGLRGRAAAALLVALSLVASWEWLGGAGPFPDPHMPRLFAFFAAGVLLRLTGENLPSNAVLALMGLPVVVLANYALPYWLYVLVAPLALAYSLLWLGAHLLIRVGQRNDISYGLYVHAFPLQQAFVATGVAGTLGPVWFAVLSVMATLPLAWGSWLLIERPAMSLRFALGPPKLCDGGHRPLARIHPKQVGAEGSQPARVEQ